MAQKRAKSQGETVSTCDEASSGLDDGGKVPGCDRAGEVDALVSAVAKRRVCGLAAAAERDGGPATEAEGVSDLIDNLEIAFQPDGTVVEDSHTSAGHECPPKITSCDANTR